MKLTKIAALLSFAFAGIAAPVMAQNMGMLQEYLGV